MKLTNIALTSAAIGLANAGLVSKRAVSDGTQLPKQLIVLALTFVFDSRYP
jgi:hypothetical protein